MQEIQHWTGAGVQRGVLCAVPGDWLRPGQVARAESPERGQQKAWATHRVSVEGTGQGCVLPNRNSGTLQTTAQPKPRNNSIG
jgi:hypothetical protein